MDQATLLALAGVLTAGGGVLGSIITLVFKALKDKRADALAEWQVIVDRLQQRLDVCEQAMDQQQQAITEQHAREAACDAEVSELFVWLNQFRSIAVRFQNTLKRLGHDGGEEIPPLPERRSRMDRAEFIKRTTETNANLARAVAQPPTPPPGDGS